MEFSPKWAQEKETSLYVAPDRKPRTQRQFFYKQYSEIILEIARKLPKEAKILEIGCGRGTICQYLRAEGYTNLTMLDESEEALALARKNFGYGADLVKADALKLPFGGETFDLVFSMGVSEHIDNFPGFFYEQMKVLKRGGWLICMTVPKKFSIQVLNIFGRDRFYRSSSTVRHYATLLGNLTDYGVAQDWVNPYPLLTPVPSWFEHVITSIYMGIHAFRGLFTKYPFSGSALLCQSHFIVTRRSTR